MDITGLMYWTNVCTVREQNFSRNQHLAPQNFMEKPREAYYLDKWFVITLYVAGLHPANHNSVYTRCILQQIFWANRETSYTVKHININDLFALIKSSHIRGRLVMGQYGHLLQRLVKLWPGVCVVLEVSWSPIKHELGRMSMFHQSPYSHMAEVLFQPAPSTQCMGGGGVVVGKQISSMFTLTKEKNHSKYPTTEALQLKYCRKFFHS